jgi:hypothetical protein
LFVFILALAFVEEEEEEEEKLMLHNTVTSSLLPQGGSSYLKSFRPAVVATKLR